MKPNVCSKNPENMGWKDCIVNYIKNVVAKQSKLKVVLEITKCMNTVIDIQCQRVRNYLLTFGSKIR